jgi:hypothetical protein
VLHRVAKIAISERSYLGKHFSPIVSYSVVIILTKGDGVGLSSRSCAWSRRKNEGDVVLETVFLDSQLSDSLRREQLYTGRLFVFSARPSTIALCEFARTMIEEAFDHKDPRTTQYSMSAEEFVSICAPLKRVFIHHPTTMKLLKNVVCELGCGLDDTYIDVPRLRMVTHGGYLTSGVGYLTRCSIDFRTVNIDDVVARRGASDIDSLRPSVLLCATSAAPPT